jgi:hypothetical protein
MADRTLCSRDWVASHGNLNLSLSLGLEEQYDDTKSDERKDTSVPAKRSSSKLLRTILDLTYSALPRVAANDDLDKRQKLFPEDLVPAPVAYGWTSTRTGPVEVHMSGGSTVICPHRAGPICSGTHGRRTLLPRSLSATNVARTARIIVVSRSRFQRHYLRVSCGSRLTKRMAIFVKLP